jgi:hypothetical protein
MCQNLRSFLSGLGSSLRDRDRPLALPKEMEAKRRDGR